MTARCAWTHHYSGVTLTCPTHDDAIPGGLLCAGCLIRWAAAQPREYWIAREAVAAVRR